MDYHESTLNQHERKMDEDSRLDARAYELADELLEDGIVQVNTDMHTLFVELEDDISLRIYENHGVLVVSMLATLMCARGVDSKRSSERFENELRAQLIVLNNIGKELYMSECLKMAEKETRE